MSAPTLPAAGHPFAGSLADYRKAQRALRARKSGACTPKPTEAEVRAGVAAEIAALCGEPLEEYLAAKGALSN